MSTDPPGATVSEMSSGRVVAADADHAASVATIRISVAGPHGLDIARGSERAFVACDAGKVVALDLASDLEVGTVSITGEPDAIWRRGGRASPPRYVACGSETGRRDGPR
jgi:hypothetical protein